MAGTYYAQAREYRAEAGRFTSQDLIPGFAEYPFSMNRYSYCFNSPMILVDLDGAWPKWVKDAGDAISSGIKKVGKKASEFWDKHGESISNGIKIGAAVAVGALAVVTVGALVGGVAAVAAGVGIAANAAYTGYVHEKNGGNFYDGFLIGSINTSASITFAAIIGAPGLSHIGSGTQIALNGMFNFSTGGISSAILSATRKEYDGGQMARDALKQGGVASLLGILGVPINAGGQIITAVSGLIQQFIDQQIDIEDVERFFKNYEFKCDN